MKERALLVTVAFDSLRSREVTVETAEEMRELTTSAGLGVVDSLFFRQKAPNASTLIGSGKTEEIALLAKAKKANVVIFGCELSPSQQRNLEEELGTKTIDRTQLILDIFAQRALSNEGKVQVELAQLKYLLPRLGGKGIYLSRLGGGVGTRGPGEQKLEVDRRRIRDRIVKMERALVELQKKRVAGIERKKELNLPLVALVGYTNAGKSSLFNRLTESDVLVKNKLFSTLDTTTRGFQLPGNRRALLADTVGFIRDLPHHLIESFKATLEEVTQAEVLVHVIDCTRPDVQQVKAAVLSVLEDLGASGKKTVTVFNKIDALSDRNLVSRMAVYGALPISVRTGEGIKELLAAISESLSIQWASKEFFLPKEKLGLAPILYNEGQVLTRRNEPEGAYFTVRLSAASERAFSRKLLDN